MTRHEFTKPVKAAALERSGGRCEAAGERYGLPHGVRCHRTIGPGYVHFDHFPRGAHDPHPETRLLGNCTATCPDCNLYAARHTDVQVEQKIKNVSYDDKLHKARMARKGGQDVPDPPKPRGRQGKKGPPMRTRGFQQGHQPLRGRNDFQRRAR